MNIERFTEFKTGTLVPITPEGRYHDFAFVPNELPIHWEPDKTLWTLIAEARDRVAKLDGAGGILPNPALLLRPLQRREAIKSNSIEGTYVTPEELLRFEAEKDPSRDPANERINDWREVFYYDRAMNHGCELIVSGSPLDRVLISTLHKTLLRTSRGNDKSPGEFRETQVYVEAGRRYIPPPPEHLEFLISNFERFMGDSTFDPLVRAFIAHYQFEAIHPFKDGNGRMGRLLLSLCIYKWLNHSHAWLYLSEFFDNNRREYIDRLFAVSANGEWTEWIQFCLLGTIQQAESAVATCRRLNEIKKRYEEKVGHLSIRMNAIVSRLLSDPIVNAGSLAEILKVSYNTARADIQKLIDNDILSELHDVWPKSYCAREIFDVAYSDIS